jgi:hypothetical protein
MNATNCTGMTVLPPMFHPMTDNVPTWQAMLHPTWQQRHQQQQPQLPAVEAGQQQQEPQPQQQPADSEAAQEQASHAAEGANEGSPSPGPSRPSKRPRIDSPAEHQSTPSSRAATLRTSGLGLALLCESEDEAAAAEHLLRHAYCLPLPACPVMLVRVLLLATKYQVELGELVDSLWNTQYDVEALKLLEEAAQLEVPKDIKRLLQVRIRSLAALTAIILLNGHSYPHGRCLEANVSCRSAPAVQ